MLWGDHHLAAALRELEHGAKVALRTAIGVPMKMDPMVRDADMQLLASERRDLRPPGFVEHLTRMPDPLPENIVP